MIPFSLCITDKEAVQPNTISRSVSDLVSLSSLSFCLIL